ncbi:hypothetical protein FWK35_00028547 [Aphis craccivora]|uniref:Uncharacterized protein n=1 Tax=Aphis craccivora TaxID=307492 RepID=A0A6G0YZK4_APHCR|nr:hypothetical protein FWK35_00028547 [Aphis craccivora]
MVLDYYFEHLSFFFPLTFLLVLCSCIYLYRSQSSIFVERLELHPCRNKSVITAVRGPLQVGGASLRCYNIITRVDYWKPQGIHIILQLYITHLGYLLVPFSSLRLRLGLSRHRHQTSVLSCNQLVEHQARTLQRLDHVRGNTARLGEPQTPAQKGQNGVCVQILQPDVQQTLFAAYTRTQPYANGQLPVRDVLQVVQTAGQPATTQINS